MIVTCPNCSTRFNLPDEQSKAGAKLRCSVCKNVFALPESDELDLDKIKGDLGDDLNLDFGDSDETPRKKVKTRSKKGLMLALSLLLLVACGGGVFFLAPELLQHVPGLSALVKPVADPSTQPVEDLISRIALSDVRQYPVNNEKTGPITVIEGKTVNGFNVPRELIKVEAALYDKDGRVLIAKQQMAGNAVSLFQLQVLGEQELEQALSNKLGVLTYNTNVPPGGEVPFMIVFYKPPENAAEFGVKIVEARNPPENQK